MKAHTSPCDPERISRLVQRKTNADEERELEQHLTQCAACQCRLSELTASPEVWDKASEYLRDDLHDSDSQVDSGSSTGGYEHLSQNIRSVLDSLAPIDDPAMLGRVDGYEISGVIGSGGMGVVLKGLDRALNRIVAIKVMAPHLATSGAARKRFAREAQAAAAITHVNVIDIYGVAEANGLPYLVMPYARGPSLQKRIDANGPLQVAEVLRIGSQIAAGLAAAHAQGLVHRDIKPANIILNDGVERLFITDFGLARAVDDASVTRTGVIAGTPQYMSPEQARGETIDNRSDLFSLGSVLYCLCTGRPPFRAEGAYGILRRITDEEPRSIREINPEIPEWLCRIISKLMSKKVDDRYDSAQEVAELLEQCLAHVQQPATSPLPTAVASPAPRVKRNIGWRRLAIPGIAVAAVLLGILGVATVLGAGAPDVSGIWYDERWGEIELKPSTPGEYDGTFSGMDGTPQGIIRLRWLKKEGRFNGTWTEGATQSGKISLRLSDNGEIRGAMTSQQIDSRQGTGEAPKSGWTTQSQPRNESGAANAGNPANSIAMKQPRLGDFTWRRTAVVPSIEYTLDSRNPLQETKSLNISGLGSHVDFRVSNIRAEDHLLKFTLTQIGPPVTDAFLEIQFQCNQAAVLPERGVHSLDEVYFTPQHTVMWLGPPAKQPWLELPIKESGQTIVFAFPDEATATSAAKQLLAIGDRPLLVSQQEANKDAVNFPIGIIHGENSDIGGYRTDFRLLFRSLAPNASSDQIPRQRVQSGVNWQRLYTIQAMNSQVQIRLEFTDEQKQKVGQFNAELMKSATPLTQHEWEPRTQAAMQDILTLQQDQQLRRSIWLMLNVFKFRESKVQEALSLTQDQMSQVAKVWDELGMQIGRIRDAREATGQGRPKWGESIGVDSMAIHQKLFDDIFRILTEEQKRTFFSEIQNPVFPGVIMQSPHQSAAAGGDLFTDVEGQLLLWRDGHVLAVNPQSQTELSLPKDFEGKRGSVRVDKSGRRFLVYLHNRLTNLPKTPEEHDRVYVVSIDESGKPDSVEIKVEGVSLCGAFWSPDGRTVLGQGLAMSAEVDDSTIPDLTKDFVSWEFDLKHGTTERRNLPGNIQILDASSDGRSFLAYQYLKTGYSLGIYTLPDEAFIELSNPGEIPLGNFRLSSDGKSVLGRIDQTGNAGLSADLVVIDVATQSRKAVAVPKEAYAHEACWSPDGKRIAFVWEPHSAYTARTHRLGPSVPGEDIPKVTITIARPDGSDSSDIYTEQNLSLRITGLGRHLNGQYGCRLRTSTQVTRKTTCRGESKVPAV